MDKKTTKKEKHTEINTQKQKTQPKKQQQQQKKTKKPTTKQKKAKKKAEVSLGETYSSPNCNRETTYKGPCRNNIHT